MTLFPDMIEQTLSFSITGRAIKSGLVSLNAVYIRDYSADEKHAKTDDYIYGGGAGLLMQAQPIYDCYRDISKDMGKHRVIYMSPQGRTFDQSLANELSRESDLVFLCGHYEGVDERVIEEIVTDEISIGDYVLTGGELGAIVVIDAVTRLIDGVLHNDESAVDESFSDNLLEYPQYSRPEVWNGRRVPEILLSGDHGAVDKWRLEQSIKRTKERRPDLYRAFIEKHPEHRDIQI